jgi:hypothetical protein
MRGKIALITMAAQAYGAMYYLGRTWGSTKEERSRPLPGDEIVPNPQMGGDHAITIDAPRQDVWPWLVQMGWHQGGWYTYRWVDALLFPANAPSTERILPEFQDLKVGDTILDGPPELGCFFRVERLEPHRHLVLHSTTHLPPQLLHKEGVSLSWTWTFTLEPVGTNSTRFQFRWRAVVRPVWLRVLSDALVTPADFIMGRSMCQGLKRRAERLSSKSELSPAESTHAARS